MTVDEWPRRCLAGTGYIQVGKMKQTKLTVDELLNSNAKIQGTLQTNLKVHGYLYIKNIIPKHIILKAKAEVSSILTPKSTENDPLLMQDQNWIRAQEYLMEALEHKYLHLIFELLYGTEFIKTLDFKWLRAVGNSKFTGLHNDEFYLSYLNLGLMYTAWIPLMDISLGMGAMVIADKSHQSTKWDGIREHYKTFDITAPGTTNGWICSDPNDLYNLVSKNRKCKDFNLEFVSSDFEVGDVCILDLKTFHMTAANTTDLWRISCDTRWLSLDEF